MPRIAPTRKPHASEPAAQPIRMPITITAAVVPMSTDPAPARLRFGRSRLGSIRREHTKGAEVCDTRKPRQLRKSARLCTATCLRRAPLAAGGFLAPAQARVRELDDLEDVDDVDRECERDEADSPRRQRFEQVPLAALAKR